MQNSIIANYSIVYPIPPVFRTHFLTLGFWFSSLHVFHSFLLLPVSLHPEDAPSKNASDFHPLIPSSIINSAHEARPTPSLSQSQRFAQDVEHQKSSTRTTTLVQPGASYLPASTRPCSRPFVTGTIGSEGKGTNVTDGEHVACTKRHPIKIDVNVRISPKPKTNDKEECED